MAFGSAKRVKLCEGARLNFALTPGWRNGEDERLNILQWKDEEDEKFVPRGWTGERKRKESRTSVTIGSSSRSLYSTFVICISRFPSWYHCHLSRTVTGPLCAYVDVYDTIKRRRSTTEERVKRWSILHSAANGYLFNRITSPGEREKQIYR